MPYLAFYGILLGNLSLKTSMADVSYEKFFDINEILKSIKSYLPNLNEKKFLEAFYFAEKAHRGQMRKDDTTPYIAHPVEVVKILTFLHADEDTLISALLHDVPEDTEHDLDEIKELFGERITFLVDGITKLSKVQYKNDMPVREVGSLKKLFLHSGKDLRVILIKLADRLHNMRTLGNVKEANKRTRISRETLEIYVPIANLLGLQCLKSELEDLCFKNLFPDEYEKLFNKRKEQEPRRLKSASDFMSEIQNECKNNGIEAKLSKKKKSLYSIYKKLIAMRKSVDAIDERISIKAVVGSTSDCYKILGIIHGKFVPINDRFSDYIANPKINGYKSLHTSVFGVDGVLTEVQIRTDQMDFEAENGIAACLFTDEAAESGQKHSKWVNKILEIEKNQNDNEEFMENIKLDVLQDRIFVFTPKGSAIDLPKGATVLDFAYALHSNIGNHALKADIKGKSVPITYVLNTGEVVQVITSKNVHPELSWTSLVITNLAKKRIMEHFRRIGKDRKITEGHKILQKEFDISGLGLFENLNFKRLRNKLEQKFKKNFENSEDLLSGIAEGGIRARDVVKVARESEFFKKIKKSPGGEIKIDLKILAKNRFGLLRDIAEVMYKNVLDMYTLKGWASREEEDAYFTTEILVPNLETVSHIFDELKQVEGVISVYRISSKGTFLFYLVSFITAVIWIAHPFILQMISISEVREEHVFITDLIIYFGLSVLIFTVLYLTNIVQKYFPLVRQKKLIWIVSFSIPALATLVLFFELFYFQLELSWLVILIEIALIYGYLLMSYINFRKITLQT